MARYSQGLNIDEPLAMLRSGTTSYYQADGLGSLTSLSNTSGALANTYTYDSFGNLVASSGSLVNSFRYAGREFDLETSIYYYRARYYDPTAGHFISEDPLKFFGGDVDFYRYVWNSAVNSRDALGLSPDEHLRSVEFANCQSRAVRRYNETMIETERGIQYTPLKNIVTGIVSGAVSGCLFDVETGCLPRAAVGAAVGAVGGAVEGILHYSFEEVSAAIRAERQLKKDLAACGCSAH